MRFLILILAALTAGCETTISKEEIASTNFGSKPERWQEAIRAYLDPRIPDPKVARITFRTQPQQMLQKETPFRARQWGWAVCVWIDENHPRGHTGTYPMVFFFRDENMVTINGGPDDANIFGAQYARQQCDQLGSPFNPKSP